MYAEKLGAATFNRVVAQKIVEENLSGDHSF